MLAEQKTAAWNSCSSKGLKAFACALVIHTHRLYPKMPEMKRLTLILWMFGFLLPSQAQQTESTSPIIFIYDASGSMWGRMGDKTKIEIATTVLSDAVEKLPADQQVGLVAYGHRREGDCQDVAFLVDATNTDKSAVTRSLKGIKPLGRTPLAYSALQVIARLRESGQKATIILVTDGIESCGGDLCAVIRAAREEGIDFRLHIIGFGLKPEETEALKCAAEAGDGQYYDAADAGALGEGLNEATAATVDDPEGNFSVFAIKNEKPIDAYVEAFRAGTNLSVATGRTYGDSVFIYLPPGTYDLLVRPLENSDVDALTVSGVQSVEGSGGHQTVSFDGGKLQVTALNNGESWDAVVQVFPDNATKNVASGRTYGRSDTYELNPGKYDVEIKAMTLEGLSVTHRMEDVRVIPNETLAIEHNFQSGTVLIGVRSGSSLVDAVVRIVETGSRKNVASGRTYTTANSNPSRFLLTPGTYEVSLSALGDHKGKKDSFTIEVKAGATLEKITNF